TLTGADATLGTHTKQLNWADLGARPSGATYVVMVLDPNNVISETIETNNVAAGGIPVPDLATDAASGLTPTPDGQGVQYTYSVSKVVPGGGVPVAFYWASGPNRSDALPGIPPALTTTLNGADVTVGSHAKQLSWSDLTTRPAGATHLLMVLDPD